MLNRAGQQLGNYRIIRLLGKGGFAEVYLGEHIHLNTHAAIKVLHTQLNNDDTEKFRTEARAIAHLAHPHIVRVFDFDVEDRVPFLVMEYAPHGTLRERHPAGTRLPLDTIVSYTQQVASALQYAHDQGLIHCDVKPENMLLNSQDQIWLSDFGLVTFMAPTHLYSTQGMAQQVAGTSPYLAPEQVHGIPRVQSDQYALGVVVYEWVCGTPPFRGTAIEIATQQLLVPPPSLRKQVPDLSPAIEEIMLRVLAKDPQERFAHVQEFATALEHAYKRAPTSPFYRSSASITDDGVLRLTTRKLEPLWNVPTTFTSLVGREQEVADICALLRRLEVRLLTLVGAGGIGKTRLCLQVAAEMRTFFADGVCFVALASVLDSTLIPSAIAEAVGIQEMGKLSIFEQVKLSLRDKRLLLVLDNFEQVMTAAPLLEDLLAACPLLTVVVTSRAVLHLQAEQLFPVSPLAVPDLKQDGAALSQYAAITLFVQRAQAVLPTFQLTQANVRAVAEICVHLDGLPLAIELAAARTRLLPPQALLSRLSRRLAVLTSGSPMLPARQQTLRNTLQWSYDLLTAQEQRLFRCLSVFTGGSTLEGAEDVSKLSDETEPGAESTLDVIASLLDKSFLLRSKQEGEEPRLTMLETVREYGLECLSASGEAEKTRKAHAAYYLKLAEEAESELTGPRQAVWLECLEREHDNLRAAMQWLLAEKETESSREMALRLSKALETFWFVHGYFNEGRHFLELALAASEGVATLARAQVLNAAARFTSMLHDNDRAEVLCHESLALCESLGDQRGCALSRYWLADVALHKGRFADVGVLLEEALALFKAVNDKEYIAWSLHDLAGVLSRQGEYARAYTLFEESLVKHRELGNKRGTAAALSGLALALFSSRAEHTTIYPLLEESLALFGELGDKQGVANSLLIRGQVALSQGDVVRARSLFEENLMLRRELEQEEWIAEALACLGSALAVQGDHATASTLYEECLAIARKLDEKELIASGLAGLASVVAAQGEPAWATRLWGAAETLRDTIGMGIHPVEFADYENAVAAARLNLGEKAFAAAWAEGRTMTPEQVLAARGPATISEEIPTGSQVTPTVEISPTYPDELTRREAEVLRLVAQGLTNAQIAEALILSPHTVHAHVRSIHSKLGLTSRSAVTRYAFEHKLL